MNNIVSTLALAFIVVVTGTLPAVSEGTSDTVGVRMFDVPSPAREADLSVTVWYPAAAGGKRIVVGNNRLFRGTAGMRDAPFLAGRYPLVLISHGSGGSIDTLGWIASHLAMAGFIVAGPNHPGTTTGNSTPANTIKLWQRPADLSAVLTAMMADPHVSKHIDAERVGAMGFSLGGHTVMAIAGARVSREDYARYCEANSTMPDCVWFASDQVDMRAVEKAAFEGTSRDARISAVVAIDPSVVQAFIPASLDGITIPVNLINLGASDSAWWDAVRADIIAGRIDNARHQVISDAAHLTFLAECQTGARAFLEEVGETDPLCDDAGGRTRSKIHTQIKDMIEAAFRQSW